MKTCDHPTIHVHAKGLPAIKREEAASSALWDENAGCHQTVFQPLDFANGACQEKGLIDNLLR